MKIGFAHFDITPPPKATMGGQPFECRATGVESRLGVRAMYMDDGCTRVLIISADALLFPNDWVVHLTTRIATVTGIPARNILLAATHTHSGPATVEVLGAQRMPRYLLFLNKQVLAASIHAIRESRAGCLSVATGEARGLAFNRRFIMSDGIVETHPLKGNPHIVRPEGPDSMRLTAWRACDAAGRVLGGMIKFGCHATVMERANTLISADYPGRASEYVAAHFGKGTSCLFLQGACGNICQVNPRDPTRREVGRKWMHSLGDALGRRAIDVLKRSVETRGRIRVSETTIRLARRAVAPDLVAWARGYRDVPCDTPRLSDYGVEHYGQTPRSILSLADFFKTPYWVNGLAREIRKMERLRQEQPDVPFRLQVLAQDNWALVAIPAEVFVEWGLAIEDASPFEHTAVVELANGWHGYLPTPEAFRRPGGYETLPLSDVSNLDPSVGEQVADKALSLLRRAKQ